MTGDLGHDGASVSVQCDLSTINFKLSVEEEGVEDVVVALAVSNESPVFFFPFRLSVIHIT